MLSIGQTLALQARREPDAVAVRCGARVLTRAELDSAAGRLAAAWRDQGLRRDDVVGVALPNGVDVVLACAAVWKAGATVRHLPPGRSVPGLALLVAEPPRVPRHGEDPSLDPDLAATAWKISSTSGSTGEPRTVRAAAPARVDPDACTPSFMPQAAVQLVGGPLWHAAPFVYAMRGLMAGHELVVLPRFDPAAWLDAADDGGATWAMLVPAQMRAITDDPAHARTSLPALEHVVHLGARCPEPLKRRWLRWLGPERVLEVYAGTEAHGLTLVGGREWLDHPGCVGRGIAGTEIEIRDAAGRSLTPGEVGEVWLRREPAPWGTQGDLGRLDPEGRLWVLDRAADVMRRGGREVWPADVEGVLDEHPDVVASVVVERAGELHAVVEGAVDLAQLRAWAHARLPADLRPTSWERVEQPVRDAAGKVRRARWR